MDEVQLKDHVLSEFLAQTRSFKKKDRSWSRECVLCYKTATNSDLFLFSFKFHLSMCYDHARFYLDFGVNIYANLSLLTSSQKGIESPTKDNVQDQKSVVAGSTCKEYFFYIGNRLLGIKPLTYDTSPLPEEIRSTLLELQEFVKRQEYSNLASFQANNINTKHSLTLLQLPNPPMIPASGWSCAKCDLTSNLWLNLTDGTICCGRKFYDGSGGNNHAYEHFCRTKYPLVVKLGSLSGTTADLYSYDEDQTVTDINLDLHLMHFGLNRSKMIKTEPCMFEIEMNMSLNMRLEGDHIIEKGVKLQPLYGPGYTGIKNIGNTCYMSAVLQVIFSIPEIVSTFSCNFPDDFTSTPPNVLVSDLSFQMCKVCHALLSGDYSLPIIDDKGAPLPSGGGFEPYSMRQVFASRHQQYQDYMQQDAAEFFMFLSDQLERDKSNFCGSTRIDQLFSFHVTEYFQLIGGSHEIQKHQNNEVMLRIHIPMEKTVVIDDLPPEELEALHQSNIFQRVSWESCLESLVSPSFIDRMSINGLKGSAHCYTRISSLPEYLVMQIGRFSLDSAYMPVKLNILLTPPQTLDLSEYVKVPAFDANQPSDDFDSLAVAGLASELRSMDFGEDLIKRALKGARITNLSDALDRIQFLQNESMDSSAAIAESQMKQLIDMGFKEDTVHKALTIMGGNIDKTLEYLLSDIDKIDRDYEKYMERKRDLPKIDPADAVYEMFAFISHMGFSASMGHYICHILKDGHWVIYNDEKVAESLLPPIDRGYLYFYRRKKRT